MGIKKFSFFFYFFLNVCNYLAYIHPTFVSEITAIYILKKLGRKKIMVEVGLIVLGILVGHCIVGIIFKMDY